MSESPKVVRLWTGQHIHFIGLTSLLILAYYSWVKVLKPYPVLFWIAIACPVFHQIYVWMTWRLELNNGIVSKVAGMKTYMVLFYILFASRFLSILVLGWFDRHTLGLKPSLRIPLMVGLLLPAIFTFYSVVKYFGIERASGIDHFDIKYRNMPLVKKGIFRFTNNGMYLYGFLIFWAISLVFDSSALIIVAAFNHLYIWVHYFSTEKIDMEYIYNTEGPCSE